MASTERRSADVNVDVKGPTELQLDNTTVTTKVATGPNGVTLTSSKNFDLGVVFYDLTKGLGTATSVNGTAGAVGTGILVNSTGGNVAVNTVDLDIGAQPADLANTITGGTGIRISTIGAGKSDVLIGKDTVNGVGADGINATTGAGANNIKTAAGSNITGVNWDINALSGSGKITLDLSGAQASGGVEANSVVGDINATLKTGGTILDTHGVGLFLTTGGAGKITAV